MEEKLTKKYGLFTAIAMVTGIVIGSGIFFKTEAVLAASGGNAAIGILALLIVGAVMVVCAYTFSILAGRYERVNGVVDYAEAALGPGYAYYMGWFMAVIYYPAITSVVVWLSAVYTCQLFGLPEARTGGGCLAIAGFYLVLLTALNGLAPILSGRLQVSAAVLKLIPLLLMGAAGILRGLSGGLLLENFSAPAGGGGGAPGGLLLDACVAMAFSYEGWIVATTVNAELRDARRDLPRALVLGSAIVVVTYVLYYLGVNGSVTTAELMERGSAQAFVNVFGGVVGSALTGFVVVSCLGTANGLMLGCSRGIYALAARNEGPAPRLFGEVDRRTGMPHNSALFGALMTGAWLLFYYGGPLSGWFGPLCFDSSELPIVTLYGGYIPIFLAMMRRERDLGPVKRLVMPALSICGCVFMAGAAVISHGTDVLWYLLVFALATAVGALLRGKRGP